MRPVNFLIAGERRPDQGDRQRCVRDVPGQIADRSAFFLSNIQHQHLSVDIPADRRQFQLQEHAGRDADGERAVQKLLFGQPSEQRRGSDQAQEHSVGAVPLAAVHDSGLLQEYVSALS